MEQARRDGLSLILWTHDSLDWRYHSIADLEGHVLPTGQGAHGVFLFHDIHDSTIAAMPEIIDELAAKGCHYVTVAEWASRHSSTAGTPTQHPPQQPAAMLRRARTAPLSWFEGWQR